jgi:DNA excision repair protein ERCC-3
MSQEAHLLTPPSDTRCAIVQSDFSIAVERDHGAYADARDFLLCCAELEKCPEHLHTYRLTDLSLWNAAAIGFTADRVIEGLTSFSKFPVPSAVQSKIKDTMALWGKLQIVKREVGDLLVVNDSRLVRYISGHSKLNQWLASSDYALHDGFLVQPHARGKIKLALIEEGLPVEDIAGYHDGEPFSFDLAPSFQLRDYQQESINAFYAGNSHRGGSGVIVLPCGAGKTMVGLGTMQRLGMRTLILVASITAARQWRAEILQKSTISPDDIGEYSGKEKEIKPITIATYQVLTKKSRQSATFTHLDLFASHQWGLIIYDEVHLLPAPIFHITASVQACRRLGLTATLVREDRKEHHVFSLIGPKKYDVPWKILESKGWIASVHCAEVRVQLADQLRELLELSDKKERFRLVSENPEKLKAVLTLLRFHHDKPTLVIGMYLAQLKAISEFISAPLITGETPQKEREKLFQEFREGKIQTIVISKVGNFSIDLPDASVAIQVSGTFGSRQEEAQRLGRILRPKKGDNQGYFYSIVSADSEEEDYAMHRQLFLIEQGYEYSIVKDYSLLGSDVSGIETRGKINYAV